MSTPVTKQRQRISVSQQASMVEVLIKLARDEQGKSGRQAQQIALAIEGATRAVETLRFPEANRDKIREDLKAEPLQIEGEAR